MRFCSKVGTVVVLLLLSVGFARDVIVPANASRDEVQRLINEAGSGDTIVFEGGSYGPFDASLVVTDTNLSFVSRIGRTSISNDGDGPVLRVQNGSSFSCTNISFEYDGRGTDRNTDVVVVTDGFVSIQSCNFSGGVENPLANPPLGSGLLLSGDVTGAIVDSTFTNNEFNGITVQNNALPGNTAGVNIMRNIITNNGHDGVLVRGNATPLLESNKINANREDGVSYEDTSSGLARNNIVDGNGDDGFDITDSATPTVEMNTVFLNGDDGFEISVFAAPDIMGNDVRDNEDVAFSYEYIAGGTIDGNTCQNNRGTRFVPIGDGDVILVPTTSGLVLNVGVNNVNCTVTVY
ncbi:MAG: right-handed parallel beta-helix repeat-containing protein [Deinococcota bacterium]